MHKKSPKKPARKHTAAAPQPAQLEAVRKLLRTGRADEAADRARELHARYPGFTPLLALGWEACDSAGLDMSAALFAWDWSRAAPGSLVAFEALRDSALRAGFAALGTSAEVKLKQARGEPVPNLPPLSGPLYEITFEQGVRSDLSRLLLACNRYEDVVALLQDEDHPSLRNNLALARFAQGDAVAALTGFEAVHRDDARNLLALYYLVRLRLWVHGRAAAEECLPALRSTDALRAVDAFGKMFGLVLLGEFDAASAEWDKLSTASFWKEEEGERAAALHLAGIAAWRRGASETAAALFDEAAKLDPYNLAAFEATLAMSLTEPGRTDLDLRAGTAEDWLPPSWLATYRAAKSEAAQDAVFDAQIRACDAHADYLATAAELGGPGVRVYAFAALKTRAQAADPAAIDALRGLLTRPCGPDKVRVDLDIWLQENGFVDAGQPQPMLINGAVRELQLLPSRLTTEPRDTGLPSDAQAKLEHLHLLKNRGDLRGALRLAIELDATHPGQPMLIGFIATFKATLGEDPDEVEALFESAAAIDPGYLFAQIGLAQMAIRRGDFERANALLGPLRQREEYHISEWRAVLAADHALALGTRDDARARALQEALEKLDEELGG